MAINIDEERKRLDSYPKHEERDVPAWVLATICIVSTNLVVWALWVLFNG